jgi:hypothetical protein
LPLKRKSPMPKAVSLKVWRNRHENSPFGSILCLCCRWA